MTASLASAIDRSNRPARRPWRFGAVSLGVLGLLCALGSALATGYGLPWIYFVALGLFGTAVLDLFARTVLPRHGLLVQLTEFATIGCIAAALGAWSSRPNPAQAFTEAFAVSPPAGVSELRARRQFFDAKITVFRFRATADAIKQITAARTFKQTSEKQPWTASDWRRTFHFAPIVDRSWKDAPPLRDPHVFEWQRGETHSAAILWDAATGETYAQYAD